MYMYTYMYSTLPNLIKLNRVYTCAHTTFTNRSSIACMYVSVYLSVFVMLFRGKLWYARMMWYGVPVQKVCFF